MTTVGWTRGMYTIYYIVSISTLFFFGKSCSPVLWRPASAMVVPWVYVHFMMRLDPQYTEKTVSKAVCIIVSCFTTWNYSPGRIEHMKRILIILFILRIPGAATGVNFRLHLPSLCGLRHTLAAGGFSRVGTNLPLWVPGTLWRIRVD